MQSLSKRCLIVVLAACLAGVSTEGWAADDPPQSDDDEQPLIEQLRDLFKNESLQLGSLIQTGFRYSENRSGFSLGTARLKVEGALDGGFNYKIQTDFAESVSLKDALIGYQATNAVALTGGRYKTPFSYEELTSSSATRFIERSRIVRALAPSRQIGAHITGSPTSTVNAHVGVYNGNNANLAGNNNRFLYVGRLETLSETENGEIAIGANGAYDDEPSVGDETLVGADFHVEHGPLLVSAEAIYGRQDVQAGTLNPFGHHLTFGYALPTTETSNRLLVRWDRYTPDTDATASDQILVGYIGEPTSTIRVEANYVFPLEEREVHRAMLQVQLAF